MTDFAAYDLFLLRRQGARECYSDETVSRASERFEAMSGEARSELERNTIDGLPGGEGRYDRDGLKDAIERFSTLDEERYRAHLFLFLRAIIPVAEEADVVMATHPDDPPFRCSACHGSCRRWLTPGRYLMRYPVRPMD